MLLLPLFDRPQKGTYRNDKTARDPRARLAQDFFCNTFPRCRDHRLPSKSFRDTKQETSRRERAHTLCKIPFRQTIACLETNIRLPSINVTSGRSGLVSMFF